jgi:hypothetical protein
LPCCSFIDVLDKACLQLDAICLVETCTDLEWGLCL